MPEGVTAKEATVWVAAISGSVEVPCDPPGWSPERRDWLLPDVLEIAPDGTVAPPPGPGLGVELDLEALERWRIA